MLQAAVSICVREDYPNAGTRQAEQDSAPAGDTAHSRHSRPRSLLGVATAVGAVRVHYSWLRGRSVSRLSRVAWLYIGAVMAVAAVAIARGPFAGIQWQAVAVLGLLLIACESSATLLDTRGLAWSANSIASLAAMILVGPVGAAIVGCCTLLGVRRGPSP